MLGRCWGCKKDITKGMVRRHLAIQPFSAPRKWLCNECEGGE